MCVCVGGDTEGASGYLITNINSNSEYFWQSETIAKRH